MPLQEQDWGVKLGWGIWLSFLSGTLLQGTSCWAARSLAIHGLFIITLLSGKISGDSEPDEGKSWESL